MVKNREKSWVIAVFSGFSLCVVLQTLYYAVPIVAQDQQSITSLRQRSTQISQQRRLLNRPLHFC